MKLLLCVIEIAFLVSTSLVSACEGDCITGITDAFIRNYTAPMRIALEKIADTIVAEFIPDNKKAAITYLDPIMDEYNRRAYDYMENAIFKSCFHGKCLDPNTGLEPAGCPNPDCPLICGTPGSLIHFYSKLVNIVFNSTAGLFEEIADTDSAAFRKVEQSVIEASSSNTRRRYLRFFKRFHLSRQSGLDKERSYTGVVSRDKTHVRRELHTILHRLRDLLAAICGRNDSDNGDTNDLPNCSWKQAFHDYILSFP